MTRRTSKDWIAEGRRIERADINAHLAEKAGACLRAGARGDDGAKLLGMRIDALRAGIVSGIHEGDASNG